MESFLDALLSPDNAVRRQAEAAFAEAKKDPSEAALQLVQCLSTSAAQPHRHLCAVLLRRLVQRSASDEIWSALAPATQETIKQGVLDALAAEPQQYLRHNICHLIGELAATAAGEGCEEWPALLPAVFELAVNEDAAVRKLALFLFGKLAEYGGSVLLEPHCDKLVPSLSALLDDTDPHVAVESLLATQALITRLENEENTIQFMPHVEKMVTVLQNAMTLATSGSHDEDAANRCLKALATLAGGAPHLLKPILEPMCTTAIEICNTADLDESTRGFAMEFLITLAESAGPTVRKAVPLLKALVNVCLDFMSLVEEDEGWAEGEDDPASYIGDEGEGVFQDLVRAGASGIDRVAQSIGGKAVLPVFSAQWSIRTASKDWRQRRSAIIGMSLILEGCKRLMAPRSRDYVEQVLPFVEDAHPRVRHAAARCLGQMAADFSDPDDFSGDGANQMADAVMSRSKTDSSTAAGAGIMARARERAPVKSIQETAADILIPALATLAASNDVPRIRGLACAAITNLIQPIYAEPILPFLTEGGGAEPLMTAVFAVLEQVPEKFYRARGAGLVVISDMALLLEDAFEPFFEGVMTPLRDMISTAATNPDQQYVQMRAVETLSCACQAVRKEVCANDAVECVRFIIHGIQDEKRSIEAFKTFALSLIRIAQVLGEDFTPFLGGTLSFLGEKAEMEVSFTITDADTENPLDLALEEDEGKNKNIIGGVVEVKGLGSRRIALDSVAKEEKLVAMTALFQLVADTGVDVPAMWNVLDPIIPLLLQHTAFADMRQVSAMSMLQVFRCALADVNDATHAQRVLDQVVEYATAAMLKEYTIDGIYIFADTLAETLLLAYQSTTEKYNGPDAAAGGSAQPTSPPSGSPGGVVAGGAAAAAGASSAAGKKTKYSSAIINFAQIEPLFKMLQQLYEKCAERRKMAAQVIGEDEDADEEDADRLAEALEDEDNLIQNLTDILGYCVKMHGPPILSLLQEGLGNYLLNWLNEKDAISANMRCAAMCMIDDLVEFASPDAHVLIDLAIPHMLEGIASPNNIFRHPSAYGAGVFAQFGGAALTSAHIQQLVPALMEAAVEPGAREGDMDGATDNAISSLVKLVRYRPADVNADEIMSGVVGFLPLMTDQSEAKLVHGWMIQGLLDADPLWMGEGGSRVPTLIAAIAKALRQHRINTHEGTDADEAAGEEMTEEELFEEDGEGNIPAITALAAAVRASPQANMIASLISSFNKHERAVMAEFGFPVA